MTFPSKFILGAVGVLILPGLASAATSSFNLGQLGVDGTETGTINVANADAAGGQVTVTVTTNVQGTGNTTHMNAGVTNAASPPASPASSDFGYIFGSGDNGASAAGNDATTLTSFTSITLAFSEPVTLDSLLIRDIDQSTNGTIWIDTIWAEFDTGTPTYSAGSSIEDIAWAGTTAYRNIATGNDGVGNLANQLEVSSTSTINSITIFNNNSVTPTPGSSVQSHGVDIGTAISFTVVPEPSSALLLGLGLISLARRRR